jgi:hypothetical protein
MPDVTITLKLPHDLVEQADAAGIEVESITAEVIALLKQRIARRQALAEFRALTAEIDALPDAMKPTEAEIIATVREVRRERAAIKLQEKSD